MSGKDFSVGVKLLADTAQYSAELTRAGQTLSTFTTQVQGGSAAASGALQSTTTAAQAMSHAIDGGNKVHVKGAMSAKEHAMAMRMLPMQMTDVVTSLASGMPIWMVAIQQGGQIKDSFHGVGNALRAMSGAITPAVAGIGLLAGAAGLAAAAYYQGGKEQDAFAQSIITTGNASGVTVSQLRTYAQAIDGVVGTQAQAAEGLAAFTAAGVRGGDQLQQYTQTTIEWERATGQAVGKTAEQFASLQKDPLTAVIKLNDGTNFLTLSVYEQIKALAGQGKSAEASRVAMDALDAAMRERSKAIEGNLGYIERAWRGITGAAKEAWDAMLNVGRGTTDQQNLDQLRQNLARLEERNATLGIKPGKQTDDLRAQVKALEDKIAAENASADATARGNVQLQARIEWDKAGEKFLGKQARMEGELTKARAEGAAAGATAAEIERRLAAIRENYKESKAAGGITVSDAQLANLQGQLQAAKLYGEQLATLGAGASQLNAGERESLEIGAQLARVTDAKTIARLQEKQAIADALGVQLRSNAGLEASFKAHQALIDATAQDADALNQRAAAQEAANQVFGKGRTAIEEMTLAELQKQMAEAQGSDSFDPKYIASLELKIAAQKRWVGALQGADNKAAEQHVNELLRGAKELAKAYEDEQALSGLTALEREKLVALRQVELKYAKELAAIDAKALADTEKQALRDKVQEARRIEGAAAVAKAEQQHMARAADEINRSLTDALMRGFESGKGFAQNLADTTVNLFKTMVLRPTISAIMTPVSLAINGVVQQGMNAVGLGGGSNLMGMASNASSLYSLASGNSVWGNAASTVGGWMGLGGATASGLGLSSAAAAAGMWGGGAAAGTGMGLTMGGAGLGMTAGSAGAGAIGAGIGTSAAAGGAGITGALAAVPVWGWALAAVAALFASGAFSSRGANHSGGVFSTQEGSDRASAAAGLGLSGNALGDFTQRANTAIDDQLGKTVGALSGVYQSLSKYAGDSAKKIDIVAGFAVNGKHKDEDSYGYFRLLDKLTGEELVNYSKRDGGLGSDPAKAWEQYVADMGTALVGEIRKADIPKWMDNVFAGLGDKITTQGLDAALQQIAKIDSAFTLLGNNIGYLADISGATQSALIELSGGIDGLMQNAGTYYQNFYSADEQRAAVQRQLSKAFQDLDLTLPDIDASDARAQFKALAEAQDLTAEAGRKTYAALLGLSGAFAGVTQSAEDAAAAAKQLAKEQERARQGAIDSAYRSLQATIGRDRKLLDMQSAMQSELVANLTGVITLVRDQARDLLGQVQSTADIQAAKGLAFIDDALRAARNNGGMPDRDALATAIGAARSGLDSSKFATQFDLDFNRLVLAGKLADLGDISGDQLTLEEQTLQGIEKQIRQQDEVLDRFKNLIDVSSGNVDATMTVTEAIRSLEGLLFPSSTGSSAGGSSGSGASLGGGSFGPAAGADAKYSQVMSGGSSGAVWYQGVTSESMIDRLDKLAPIYHGFDGTGDLAGLAAAIKAAGGTVDDLSILSGHFASDWRNAFTGVGVEPFATGAAFTNGIVSRPTRFNIGEMGEDGSEGILPLANIGGRLGVHAIGGGSNNTEVVAELRAVRAVLTELKKLSAKSNEYAKTTADAAGSESEGYAKRVIVVTP